MCPSNTLDQILLVSDITVFMFSSKVFKNLKIKRIVLQFHSLEPMAGDV